MDLVYIVRPGDRNEPLRYSLRSLTNLPHRNVWIVGHKPAWVTGVKHVPGNRGASKPQNVFDNVRIACSISDLGDEFVMMNDDFFIMRPFELDLWWRCRLDEHIAAIRKWSAWKQSLIATRDLLDRWGHTDPLSYEVHVPLITRRAVMGEVLARASGFSPLYPPQWRTLYGAAVGGGSQLVDVKVHTAGTWDPNAPLLSCSEGGFAGPLGEFVSAAFPTPCAYEGDAP